MTSIKHSLFSFTALALCAIGGSAHASGWPDGTFEITCCGGLPCRDKSLQTSREPERPAAPAASGNFCHTLVGRFGPVPEQKLGAPCWVNLPIGLFYGGVGT